MATTFVQTATEKAKTNISAPVVTSVVVGMGIFGAITYFAVKSGVGPLKEAAKVAQGKAK